jgi:hypothetical protein
VDIKGGGNGRVVQKCIINLAVYKGLFPNFFSSYDWAENVSLGVRIGENRTRRVERVRTSPWDFHIPYTFAVANVVPKHEVIKITLLKKLKVD